MRKFLLGFILLGFSCASATAQPNNEQFYRSVLSALAQDNLRLGTENAQLVQRVEALTKQLEDLQKAGKEKSK